jgi:hypothetical protein
LTTFSLPAETGSPDAAFQRVLHGPKSGSQWITKNQETASEIKQFLKSNGEDLDPGYASWLKGHAEMLEGTEQRIENANRSLKGTALLSKALKVIVRSIPVLQSFLVLPCACNLAYSCSPSVDHVGMPDPAQIAYNLCTQSAQIMQPVSRACTCARSHTLRMRPCAFGSCTGHSSEADEAIARHKGHVLLIPSDRCCAGRLHAAQRTKCCVHLGHGIIAPCCQELCL